MPTQSEILRKQIEDNQKQLQELEKLEKLELRKQVVKSLDEYTSEEKIEAFDKLYNSALSELKEKENGEYSDDNNSAQYTWEDVMSLLARNRTNFWKYFNSL